MDRSLVRAAGHSVRMRGRALANAVFARRRIRGRGHRLVTSEAVLRRVRFDVRGNGHRIEIAPQAQLSNVTITMEGENHVLTIGSHVRIRRGSFAFEDSGGTVLIGDRTTIYDASFGVTEGGTITVGTDCLFASDVDLRNGDSHSIVERSTGRRLNPAADIEVGNHVWLGERVMVLKGTRIGDHTVVGAGAIVTKDLPSGCVAAGTPAQPVLDGTDWLRERV
jgi:acetyltransferase-like isoleucine patch superfamily enzyme